MKHYLPSR